MTTPRVNACRFCTGSLRLSALLLTAALLLAPHANGQTISQRLTDILNRLNTVQSTAADALSQARAAALRTNGLPDVITRIQEVYDSADGRTRELIDNYAVMFVALLEHQREGYETFIARDASGVTPAARFRTELTAFLSTVDGLVNDLVAFDGTLEFRLRIDGVQRLIDILPDPLLYPFYVTMSRGINLLDSGMLARLSELRTTLPEVRAFLADEPGVQRHDHRTTAGRTASVSPAAYVQFAVTGKYLKISGNTLATVGKVLDALSEADDKEFKVGIHGYVAIHAKVEPVKVIAGLLEAVGDVLAKIGERVESKLDAEESKARHDALIAGQTTITSNQALLISSQASLAAEHLNLHDQQRQIIDGQAQILGALARLVPGAFPDISTVPPAASLSVDSDARRVQVDPGAPVSLSAGPVASPQATYQWLKDGVAIDGAVFSTFTIPRASADHAGIYSVRVTDETGIRTSAPADVALIPGRVLNVSMRFAVPDERPMIAGFVLDSEKEVVVRGVGQSLAAFGIPLETTMEDPAIEIYDRDGRLISSNDNYEPSPEIEATMAEVGAFPLISSTDAVIVTSLPAGAYTVHLRSRHPGGGDCIVEVYDTEPH